MPTTVKILWNSPAAIVSGTALDESQLCAEAKDAVGASIAGTFDYQPKQGTVLPPGTHELRATFHPADPVAYASETATMSITVMARPAAAPAPAGQGAGGPSPAPLGPGGGTAPVATAPGDAGPGKTAPPSVCIEGELMFGKSPIAEVLVTLTDLDVPSNGTPSRSTTTDNQGRYKFRDINPGHNVSIEFLSSVTFRGQNVVLQDPQLIYCWPCEDICLPPTRYGSKGGQVSGLVLRGPVGVADCKPLSGVTVTLRRRDGSIAGAQTTTDSDGRFCIFTEQVGLLTVGFKDYEVDGNVLFPSVYAVDVFVDAGCPSDVCIPPVTYSSGTGQLCGVVTDGKRGLKGVTIELSDPAGKCAMKSVTTDDNGLWTFPNLLPGRYQVRFPGQIPDKSLELSEQQQTQTFDLKTGEVKLAAPVSYESEPHIIERRVFIGDQPADGILVDVRSPGARSALQSARTVNGLVSFILDKGGRYEVRVYPDPQAFGDPVVDVVEVHSKTTGVTRLASPRPSPIGGAGGGFGGAGSGNGGVGGAIRDIAAYPVLTEEVGYPPSPLARPAGTPALISGTPALGQTAMKAISDVLGWQVKPDPKAFVGALNASFSLKEVGGHTEASWTPRTYAVQTDLSGGITGAQASVYTRAKGALDQSLPLLDGLYALFEEAKPEDIEALRTTVRSQFTDLVNELGLLGGPRISRVTQLFFLLLGQQFPQQTAAVPAFVLQTDPDQISGSLGNLRQEFGFSIAADQVNTVEDEQNVTNFRIISDYITSLAQSWLNNLQFFGLQTATPFFGTQLVLLSRQLSVIAEKTNEVRFTLDSVFIGPADRQTLQIEFTSGDPPMFLEDVLTWIDSFASEEGPQLIAEGGKFAVGQSFVPIATQLQRLVRGLPSTATGSLPLGFGTFRVQNSLQNLADSLQQLVSLATPISHVITPEPEPPLAVLGINPSVVFLSANNTPTVMVVGTGFDVGATSPSFGMTVTFSRPEFPQSAGDIAVGPVTILSSNLAFVLLNLSGMFTGAGVVKDNDLGTYSVAITMRNRNQPPPAAPAVLVTDFTILR
jgi:hypothetical protein